MEDGKYEKTKDWKPNFDSLLYSFLKVYVFCHSHGFWGSRNLQYFNLTILFNHEYRILDHYHSIMSRR